MKSVLAAAERAAVIALGGLKASGRPPVVGREGQRACFPETAAPADGCVPAPSAPDEGCFPGRPTA